MALVYDPTAPSQNEPQQLRQRLAGLAGKVVGFIDNTKPNFNHLVDELAEVLKTKYGVASVIKRAKPAVAMSAPEAIFAELTAQCDLVITGSGD
jgi:hypothetical protein